MELEGRVAVISGGGSGIGRASALLFAAEGAQVLICGRTMEKLEQTASDADALPGDVVPYQADISNAGEMEALYAEVARRWNRLDVVFAHAGINGVWAPIEDLAPEEWDKTIRINLTGTFLTLKYAVPLMKGRGGSIIITSSINGTTKFSDVGSSAYCATKAGQIALTKLLALELARYRIRVNAICPGSIATDVEEHTEMRNTKATAEVAEFPHGSVPLRNGESGDPEQVAELALFLATERSSHITGTPVWIDGGQSLVQG